MQQPSMLWLPRGAQLLLPRDQALTPRCLPHRQEGSHCCCSPQHRLMPPTLRPSPLGWDIWTAGYSWKLVDRETPCSTMMHYAHYVALQNVASQRRLYFIREHFCSASSMSTVRQGVCTSVPAFCSLTKTLVALQM